MMEGVNAWLDLAVQSSLNVPHPADVDHKKSLADGKKSDNEPNITPFRILIKSLEILPSSVSSSLATPYEVKFAATLFDNLYRRFYGRTFFSDWHRGKLGTDGFFRVTLNEPLYCHLPLTHDQNCLVVQTIFRSGEDREDREERANGWTVIKLKAWTENDDIRKAISNRQVLYHGSPRALMYLNEPLESCSKVIQVASAGLFVDVKYHEPLFAVIKYLPECALFGRGDHIGGVQFNNEPNEDSLRQAAVQSNRKNILIEHLEIDMEPSIEKFEDELCRLINKDRLERQKMTKSNVSTLVQDSNNRVTIVERRLRVGTHNGYCYIQDPLVLYLTGEQEDTGLSSLSRKLSFRQTQRRRTLSAESRSNGADDRPRLYLRNPIRLDDVPLDEKNTIVFVLEYMVAIPVGVASKPNQPVEFTKMLYTIRWAAWLPGKDKQVALKFIGGDILPSDELFIYKPSTTVVTTAAETTQERLRFNYRFDTEPAGIYNSFKGKSAELLPPAYEKPPMPMSLPPSVHASADYASIQRSVTAPPRTIPAALQPPIYHQANLVPWQTETKYSAYSPMSALANQMTFASSLSRAAYARLQSHGFPTIKTKDDKEAELIDIRQPHFLNMQTELADPLNCNEINLHFLAYFKTISAHSLSSKATYPKSLYFTFKFYRFGETTTSRVVLERLHEKISNDPNVEPYILWRLKEDSTKTSGVPGLPVKFQVDGAFLGSVEQRQFFEYLDTRILYVEVWDGDGLFPIGMCGLELRYLLRDARPAVQALVELDVFSSSSVEATEIAAMENQYYQSTEQQFSLAGEKLKAVGKLVMRIGNVGIVGSSPSAEKLKTSDALRLLPTSRIIAAGPPFDVVQSRPGEITTGGVKDYRLSTAHRIVEAYPGINSVLHNPDKQAQDAERQRKLARMEAVRKRVAQVGTDDASTVVGTTNRKMRELRENDLRAISMYRHQTKHDDIAHHLMKFITREVNIRLMPGHVEFFEFALQNPYPNQHSITIACDDDELSVVTDSREWRRLKTLFEVFSETEENMFTNQAGMVDQSGLKYPQIFLRGKESVNVPFKLQTFLSRMPVPEQKTASNPFAMEQSYSVVEKNFNERLRPKQIQAKFQAEDGTPIAILVINVEYMSPVIDQTIRCINGENTLLKRVFRVPNPRRAITTESLSSGLPEQVHQVFVRASDSNIVCEVQPVPVNQPCNMLIKAASHSAPTVNSFLIFIYPDGFMHRPTNVWQFQIHAVKRLDLTCVQYQTSTATLLLRGKHSSRLVQCFSNAPEEVVLSPSNAFSLAANGLHEVHLLVRPARSGLRTYTVNAVDVENHQVVDTWMIKVDTRMPVISKQFAHTVPIGESQPIHKRISYTNPYAIRKTFFFISSHPELLQLQHQKLDFQANEKKFINFILLPAFNVAPVTDIIILINNEQDTNEDAYAIRVTYTDAHGSI